VDNSFILEIQSNTDKIQQYTTKCGDQCINKKKHDNKRMEGKSEGDDEKVRKGGILVSDFVFVSKTAHAKELYAVLKISSICVSVYFPFPFFGALKENAHKKG
jgi:hypothetical protein